MLDDIKAVTELVQKQGETFEQFKKANDALLAAKASGESISDIQAKLAAINTDFAEQRKSFDELAKKASRPGAGTAEEKSADKVEHAKAFDRMLRKGRTDGLEEIQAKAMNTQSDPDGGYTVLPEMDRNIDRFLGTVSIMSRLASTVTIGTSQYQKMVQTSGMTMRRIAEGTAGGESTEPKFGKLLIDVHTAEVEPWVNNETLDDSFVNLTGLLSDEAAIAFAEGLGAEYITGNGVGKGRGIAAYNMVANSAYAWGSVGYIATGKSAAFASVAPSDKVIALQHALKPQYRPGAVWLANDATVGVMRQMKDGSGAYYLWQPDPAGAFGGRFLGAPVEVDDNIADIGAGSLSLAYGNFRRAYTIVNRAGTTLIRDNITSKGVTKFNFRRRSGSGITDYAAIKFLKFATG